MGSSTVRKRKRRVPDKRSVPDDPPGGIPGTYQGSEGVFFRTRWRPNLGGVGGYLNNIFEENDSPLLHWNIDMDEFVPRCLLG